MENKMPPLTLVRSAGQNCYGGNEGYTISSIPPSSVIPCNELGLTGLLLPVALCPNLHPE